MCMAAIKWRRFFNQWKFFSGDEKPATVAERWRSFIADKFGAQVFSSDDDKRDAWRMAYIVEGNTASRKAEAMNAAIAALKSQPATPPLPLMNAYQRLVNEVAGSNSTRDLHFASVYLDLLVANLLKNVELNPEAKQIVELSNKIPRLKNQADHVAATEAEHVLSQLYNKQTSHKVAIHEYILERIRAEAQNQIPAAYAFPGTSYAMYQKKCGSKERPLDPPTFSSVVGLRIVNPFYWLNASVGGACKFIARAICGAINSIAGEEKNSKVSNVVKGVFAGPFILTNMLTSLLSKVFSVSGWAEVAVAFSTTATIELADMRKRPESARIRRALTTTHIHGDIKKPIQLQGVLIKPGHHVRRSSTVANLVVGDANTAKINPGLAQKPLHMPRQYFVAPPLGNFKKKLPAGVRAESVSEIDINPKP